MDREALRKAVPEKVWENVRGQLDGPRENGPASLDLPWPPTVNHYWKGNGAKRFICKAGVEFRARVIAAVQSGPARRFTGRLAVSIDAHPPDKRKRDLDNLLKASLDALQHSGLFDDDSQIDRLAILRGLPMVGGGLTVRITEL